MSAPANRWLVLVAMTGSLSMIMLDQTVVTVALPAMSDDLGLRPTGQQWVVNAYVLALTALVAFGGKLGDRVGGSAPSSSASPVSSSPPPCAGSPRSTGWGRRGSSPPARCRARRRR